MNSWIRTKTGRLKAPPFDKALEARDGRTVRDGPLSKVGDYIFLTGSISAGTVGKVIEIVPISNFGDGARIECLSGQIKFEWHHHCHVIPYSMVQEVKDWYLADGRPERIKVKW